MGFDWSPGPFLRTMNPIAPTLAAIWIHLQVLLDECDPPTEEAWEPYRLIKDFAVDFAGSRTAILEDLVPLQIVLLDVKSGAVLDAIAVQSDLGSVLAEPLIFSPNGEWLAVVGASGMELHEFAGKTNSALGVGTRRLGCGIFRSK